MILHGGVPRRQFKPKQWERHGYLAHILEINKAGDYFCDRSCTPVRP